jgi:hypothetical protein
LSITDLLREGFQRHGDSPTVKHYTDWGVFKDVFEKLANGELGLERKILVEASGGVRIEGRGEISLYEQNSNLSKYHMILSNEAIVAGFHGGKGFINVKPVAEAGVLRQASLSTWRRPPGLLQASTSEWGQGGAR